MYVCVIIIMIAFTIIYYLHTFYCETITKLLVKHIHLLKYNTNLCFNY